jgi:uncharacterized coiled-coil DUF342 family protein
MAEEKLIFEVKLDVAEAAKRAGELNDKLGVLVRQRERLSAQRSQLKKSFQESIKAQNDAIKAADELRKKIKALGEEEGDNSEELARLNKELEGLERQQAEAGVAADKYSRELALVESNLKEVRKEITKTDKDFKNFPGTLDDNRASLIRLKDEIGSFRIGIDGTADDLEKLKKKAKELNDEISSQEQSYGQYSRNVGNYTESIKEAFGSLPGPVGNFTNALTGLKEGFKKLAALGPAGLIIGGIAGIAAGTAAVVKYGVELDKTRDKIKEFSDAQGDELDKLNAAVSATSSVYQKDIEDITKVSTVFFQEFKDLDVKNQAEAVGLIRKGFSAGADAGGEYLDILKEYPAQLREIGLTGSQSIALISQQPKAGVFSDKGIDAIKEANLRIREMPNTTRDALEAIGLDTAKIQKELRSGQTTTFEVMQSVSEKLAELPPQSKEVGQSLADIFGGAGEDAGLRYITSLKDINLNLDEVTATASESAKAQLRISEATERINLQFTKLFSGSSAVFQNLKADALEFVAGALEKTINGVASLINFFIDLYNESTLIRGIWEGLKAVGVTLFETLKLQAKTFFSYFKSAGKVIGAVLKGEFSSIPALIKAGQEERKQAATEAATEVGNAWKGALENTRGRDKVAFVSFGADEEAAVTETYRDLGNKAGNAFNDGVKNFDKKGKQTIEIEAVKNVDFKEINSVGIDLMSLTEENNERLKIDKEFFEKRREENRLALENEKAELSLIYEEDDEKRIERETQINEQLREIRRSELEVKLVDLKEGSAAALEIEFELIALKKEAKDEELEADKERVAKAKEIEAERIALARVGLRGVQDVTQGIIDAFGEQSAAGKAAIVLQKTAAAAEVGINLQQQISSAITTGAKIAEKIPPPAGIALGTIYTATSIASYTARAASTLAEIAGFKIGGETGNSGGESMYIDAAGNLRTSPNLSFDGKQVENVGSFAGGGTVKGPSVGLVGERGTEYVVPAPVLKTKEGRQKVAELEQMRARILGAFQFGGTTTGEELSYKDVNKQTIEELISTGAVTDQETINIVRTIEGIENRVEDQKAFSDTSDIRKEILSNLSLSISSIRKDIIRDVELSRAEVSVDSTTSNIDSVSSNNEKISQISAFINRQNEAISDSRLTEVLFSSFLSNDSSNKERTSARESVINTSSNVDNRADTVNNLSTEKENPFFISEFLSSQPEAAQIIKEIEAIKSSSESVTVSDRSLEGFVNSPTIAPLSASYVVPNFVLESPESREAIASIEGIRKGGRALPYGVKPFAIGGPAGGLSADTLQIPPPDGVDIDRIVKAIESLPPPILLIEDLEEANSRISELDNESSR